MRRWRAVAVVTVVGLLGLGVASCSSDDEPVKAAKDRSTAEEAEHLIESAGARGLGEALRLFLLIDDGFEEHPRSVQVLQENVGDLPGNPDFTGIEDKDGDGQDDDGNIEAHLNEEVACVFVSTGGRVDVHGGTC